MKDTTAIIDSRPVLQVTFNFKGEKKREKNEIKLNMLPGLKEPATGILAKLSTKRNFYSSTGIFSAETRSWHVCKYVNNSFLNIILKDMNQMARDKSSMSNNYLFGLDREGDKDMTLSVLEKNHGLNYLNCYGLSKSKNCALWEQSPSS